jgi:anti-sigma factor RsiW
VSDRLRPRSALPAGDPHDAAAREERHRVLIDLLGAYADGELPSETASQIDAHLVGCARCRRELDVHETMRRRLAAEPPAAASPALRARIAAAVAAAPAPVAASAIAPSVARRAVESTTERRWMALAVAALLSVAAGAAVWRVRADGPDARTARAMRPLPTTAGVPLLRDVVADYRRVVAGDLPGRARDLGAARGAVPFAVEPLRAPALRLLGVWTTDLGGEPAAVLAYRWHDALVLQYVVSEERFFRAPALRSAVAAGHVAGATDGAQHVVAWPTDAAGTVLVADLPLDALAVTLRTERVANQPAGSAD